jgi:5-(carboxyamino)imidazole ribonucleotide synthase
VTARQPVIAPPAMLGILGGGQLGRYTVVAARLAGYRTAVVDPDPTAPAGAVADLHLVADYDDPVALDELAARCSVVTTEFENPPAAALVHLAREVAVAPAPDAVATAQDRIAEKTFLADTGVPVAPFAALVDDGDLAAAGAIGVPSIVKTARLGYDGKGQRAVDDPTDIERAWRQLGRQPCVVERKVDLDAEISVILARRGDGAAVTYPLAENVHVDGILDLTVVPARVDPSIAAEAQRLAVGIAAALDYVGVLAVEMFVSAERLLVNELAPRPHNSGHWTLDASATSQFAQQVRAITGSALGATTMTVPAVAMVNLLGDLWFADGVAGLAEPAEPAWSEVLAQADARLHLYGKATPRPGRKMGHLTLLGTDVEQVAAEALRLRVRAGGKSVGAGAAPSTTIG